MMAENARRTGGPLAWMATNSVAANFLMIFVLVGGFMMTRHIRQEVFPEFNMDTITVTIPYPGADPDEVESGIVLAVEEAVRGLDGVDHVVSTASEGLSTVRIELQYDADSDKVLRDVRNAVDRITTLPDDAESPVIQEVTLRREVMTLVVHGVDDPWILRNVTETARDDLLAQPEITQVDITGAKPYEISVEIPSATLRALNLTLDDVAMQIRRNAVEVPGGTVRTNGGEILLRMDERRDTGRGYADVPIISRKDGAMLTLGQIARITDGFADVDMINRYNGAPALLLRVYRVGDQTPQEVAAAARRYRDGFNRRFDGRVAMDVWFDWSQIYKQRLDLLLKNGYIGLLLVMILLSLFLQVRLAFWVTMGIPVSFLGSMLILPYFGVTINMLSLFAFIMTLGIVVDDAIVVGENVYKLRREGMPNLQAAIIGVREMAMPVTFSILTNVVAFIPLFYVSGTSGKFFRTIPSVVVSVFVISLLEALFILPAHLGHQKPRRTATGAGALLQRMQEKISLGLETFIDRRYRGFLELALKHRYQTIALMTALLILTLGYVAGGRVGVVPMEKIDSDVVNVTFALPFGSPVSATRDVLTRIQAAGMRVLDRLGEPGDCKGVLAQIGTGAAAAGAHAGAIQVSLVPEDHRRFTVRKFIREWKAETGDIPGLEKLEFLSSLGGPHGGKPLTVEIRHAHRKTLETVATILAEKLAEFEGVSEIDDGFTTGKAQYNITLTAAGASLGLTTREIGRQIRNAYYGAEAVRQQRGRSEIKTMVRLPASERRSEYDILEMLIHVPGGGDIPLRKAAHLSRGVSYTTIQRRDGSRILNLSADVMPRSHASWVQDELDRRILPDLRRRYPGLSWSFEGERRDFSDSMTSLRNGFMIAMIAIFAMLAIPFRSYLQPAIVMTAIPFGIVGAIGGHILLGYNLSLMSMMGMVALSGVVVNDSLIFIDYVNRKYRAGGYTMHDAVVAAGTHRFRPIMLTTVTTFGGLTPLIFERSIQARFLIPMAISLGFGILFATVITLVLVPSLCMVLDDLHHRFGSAKPPLSD